MSIRKSLTVLWFVFTCSAQTWQVFGQTSAQTVTGCLSRGDSPGFYSIREEGTGFSITVTGSDDLAKYSAGNKVKLTGSTVREGDRDVFRVSNVEQLSTTCEPPLHLSMEGAREAVGRATFGVRGGIGFDPELIYVGAHAQLGPLVRSLWFRPSFEFGFGEVTKIASVNFDFAYFLPLTARGSGTDRADFWNIYMGAGPAAHLSHRSFEEADVNIDFGDWTFDGGLNIFMGLSKRSGFFAELRAGAYGPPKIKLMVGYTFRKK